MKRIVTIFLFITLITLVGCSDNGLDLENIKIDDITEVSVPTGEALPDGVGGVPVEPGLISDIDWEIIYDTDQYRILGREVPDDMVFFMLGYLTSDECVYGAEDIYKYVVQVNDKYYDFKVFNDEYDILNCELLSELAANYEAVFGE